MEEKEEDEYKEEEEEEKGVGYRELPEKAKVEIIVLRLGMHNLSVIIIM